MSSFDKLLNYLKAKNVYVVDLLQVGLTEEAIKQMLSQKGLAGGSGVNEIYQKVNGSNGTELPLGLQYFFPGNIMLSLEKSLELYDEECIDYGTWDVGFLPIFWNGNRDYLLVDCLNQNEGIYFYSPDEFRFDSIERKYDSVEHLFATVLQCFQLQAYQLGRSLEEIRYDGELVISISKKMNPASPYWVFNN